MLKNRSSAAQRIVLEAMATAANFAEEDYLQANPDVAAAVASGEFPSARWHFDHFGVREGRRMRHSAAIAAAQRQKLARIKPLFRSDMPHVLRGHKYDFLTDALRKQCGIAETSAVSSNNYDDFSEALIAENANGFVLDCGAGKRPVYTSNVINYEIVDYDTTDVLGVGEMLPFRDESIDAVLSILVLAHVRDPFACAAEIARVLKPGGKMICCAPFLQPEHGYPHHYFNMAPQGVRSLFERNLQIDDHKVIASILPVWSLSWIARRWMDGLRGQAREEFGQLTINRLLATPTAELLNESWVTGLSDATNFELASATLLFAHKAGPQKLPRAQKSVKPSAA